MRRDEESVAVETSELRPRCMRTRSGCDAERARRCERATDAVLGVKRFRGVREIDFLHARIVA